MDRLITLLAGLVVGLPGARRKALEEVLEGLRIERMMWKDDLEFANDLVERRERERDSALKDLVDERNQHVTTARMLEDARSEIDRLRGAHGAHVGALTRGKWTLKVRRRLLFDFKILVIKALRTVTGLGLKEAKEWVEAAPALNGAVPDSDTWITLSDSANDHDLAAAMDILLRETLRWNNSSIPPAPKPTCPHDVMFHPTAMESR